MASQHYEVTDKEGVQIRTTPSRFSPKVALLGWREVVEFNTDTKTEAQGYIWYEQVQNKGWWSAVQKTDGSEVYMMPYQVPHIPASNAKQKAWMEVTTGVLTVRIEPRLGSPLMVGADLKKGQIVEVHNRKEADGFLWWELVLAPNHWLPSGSLQGGGLSFMREVPSPHSDEMRLPVPWFTQIQHPTNYANDCGHTCLLMLMRYHGFAQDKTVKDLYFLKGKPNEFKNDGSGYTDINHLTRMAQVVTGNQLGIATFVEQSTMDNLNKIKDRIRNDKPTVLLVWYPALSFNNPSAGNPNFNHWVIVTGFKDNTFYINDPLWTSESGGAQKAVSAEVLLGATQRTLGTNRMMQGVYRR